MSRESYDESEYSRLIASTEASIAEIKLMIEQCATKRQVEDMECIIRTGIERSERKSCGADVIAGFFIGVAVSMLLALVISFQRL